MRFRPIPYVFILAVILFSILASTVSASEGLRPKAEDDAFWLPPEADSLTLQHSDLLANDSGTAGGIVLLEQLPVHGTVTQQGNTFIYTPADSFWSLRADSFAYTISGFGGVSTATVRIFRHPPEVEILTEGFEAGEAGTYIMVQGPSNTVEVVSSAAIVGSGGLKASLTAGSTSPAFVEWPPGLGDTGDPGGTVLLGGGFPQLIEDPGVEVALFTVGSINQDPHQASVRVVLSEDVPGHTELRVEVLDTTVSPSVYVASPRIHVTEDLNRLGIEWWDEGAMLDVNGETVRVSGIPNVDPALLYVRLGAMPISGALTAGSFVHYDEIVRLGYDQVTSFPLIAGDGFESADLSAWSHISGVQLAPSVVSPALTGQHALEVDLDVGSSCVVQTDPAAEMALTTRLRLDVTDLLLDSSSADSVDILSFGTSAADVKLQLWQPWGETLLAAEVTKNGSWSRLGEFALSGEHVVELQIQHGPSNLLNSGYLRLWVDGVAIGEIYGTNSWVTEWICLGAKGVGPSSGGELVFDDVELWR